MKNPDWSDTTHPPPPLSIFFIFFWNIWKHENNTKKLNKISPKNKNPSCGLTHPPTSEFFSDFWIFFNLTKPLIVRCGMSEICLKLKVLAEIDCIVFLTLLGVKLARNIGVQFFPPLNLVLWHIQNGRHQNHIFGYNLGPSIAKVTILMSIPMFLGTRNPIVPIKMCMYLRYFKINDKTHFWYVFGHFFREFEKN